MKIALVNDIAYQYATGDPAAVGGAERYQWLLARGLAEHGWSPVVGVRFALEPGQRVSIDGVQFVGIGRSLDAYHLTKPDPDAYLAAAEALGLPAERIVFLDDAEENVEGARAVGMLGIQVDAGAAATAFDKTRAVLGLAP